MQDRLIAGKTRRAVQGVSVAQRLWLRHKGQPGRIFASRRRIGGFVAGGDNHTDLFDTGPDGFADNNGEGGPGDAVPVKQPLERQGALIFAAGSRGDNCFPYLHVITSFLLAGKTTPCLDSPSPPQALLCRVSETRNSK
jgi:hypothetical protein